VRCKTEVTEVNKTHWRNKNPSKVTFLSLRNISKMLFFQGEKKKVFRSKQQQSRLHVEPVEIALQVWQALTPVSPRHPIISNHQQHPSVLSSHALLLSNTLTPLRLILYVFCGKTSNYS